MDAPAAWNPLTDWQDRKIDWIRVNIDRADLRRFTTRSTFKGLCHAVGFLLVVAATGSLAWLAFSGGHWILLVPALYLHGIVYGFFGDALHELSHNTVFPSRLLNQFFTELYGWLYWPWNPYFYRASHHHFHHRYTLHQGSDGEDTPNYVELTPRLVFELFFHVVTVKSLIQNLARLFTLTPTSKGWRGRGFRLDTWEQFVLRRAPDKERRQIYRFAAFCLVTHVLFVAACIALGLWFLPVLITFAPFYGPGVLHFLCSTHQHTACEANNPDFKLACGSVKLDPVTSFLYWRMEYHTEHHMYAGIPCYNLKRFSRFVADQLPPRESTLPRMLRLNRLCREKYGSWQNWRDDFGRFKGF